MTRRWLPFVLVLGVFLWTGEARSQSSKPKQSSTSKPKTTTSKAKTGATPKQGTAVGANRLTGRQHYTAQQLTQSPRSRAWAHYHRHWRSSWDVRMRSDVWHSRSFTDYSAAVTFYHYLRSRHYSRMMTQGSNGWTVSYRSPYWTTYGRYVSLGAAMNVETALRQLGFTAWLHHWSIYY